MHHKDQLLKKRTGLLAQLANHADAISGNISKSAVPPRSDNYYWRITWKEKQKTRIRYVRSEDLESIKKGIEHFAQLKRLIQQIGDINRTIVLSTAKRSS